MVCCSYNFLLSTTESGLQVIVVSDNSLGLGIPRLYIREITNKFTGSYGNFGEQHPTCTVVREPSCPPRTCCCLPTSRTRAVDFPIL